jgi:hypothetical protein
MLKTRDFSVSELRPKCVLSWSSAQWRTLACLEGNSQIPQNKYSHPHYRSV